MGERIDYVIDSAGKGYELIKKSAPDLFIDLLKVNALSTAIGIVGLLVIALIFWAVFGSQLDAIISGTAVPEFSGVFIAAIIISVIIFILASMVSAVVGSVAYNVAENRAKGKETAILDQAQKNMGPVIIYSLIMWAVILVLAVPVVGTLMFSGMTAFLGFCVFTLLAYLVYIVFIFFVQFGMFELVLGGKSAVDAIKSSASLVRANILKVLLIDIIMILVGIATVAVNSVAEVILQLIPATLGLGGTSGMILGYAIYFVLYLGVSVLVSTAAMIIMLPIAYFFWKGIKR